ncbi:MAG: FAD-binding oxidoreductase [Gammaproteobacteria bacterium]|nr:FAD-binding oxidoreductase [Gammaproteobacteria bacterium]
MSREQFTLVLRSARMVTPRVRELSLVREDSQPLEYVPGQFITMHLPFDGQTLLRNYSIATIPGGTEAIEIAAVRVEGGRATRLLFEMLPGDRVETTGPFGRFVLRDDPPARYVLVGTGTGVTPYRAMLTELGRRLAERHFSAVLLLGVRGPDELLYGQNFIDFAEQHPGFRFQACYSRTMPELPAPYERKGYVQDTLVELDLDPNMDIVYLCGNPNMIDTAAVTLRAAGFPTPNIRREKYVSSN